MSLSQKVCAVCASSDWAPLPTPGEASLTTAGFLVPDLLGKGQCRRCGNVQKVFTPRLADTDFYEKHYTYYDRVGAATLDTKRYRALADWVSAAVGNSQPARILDIGCGQGATLTFLKEHFPQAELVGLEPSTDAVEAAHANGLDVHLGRLDQFADDIGTFDLVFSNNVLQHTLDPVDFFERQKRFLNPGGHLVISCPDGSNPNIELLMADQNFSMRPRHLQGICAQAGLEVVRTLPCPGGPLNNEQLAVLRVGENVAPPPLPDSKTIDTEFQAMAEYLETWAALDDRLCAETADARYVYNFGGGLWSYALASYCPKYWARVKVCLVDKFSGRCMDKTVEPFEEADVTPDDVLVLGTNPYVQNFLIDRFTKNDLKAVGFASIIAH